MSEPSVPIWASYRGDHRAAMRSPALGARTGSVRFEVRFPQHDVISGPRVDAGGQIWLLGRRDDRLVLLVLSPLGERGREIQLPGWELDSDDDRGMSAPEFRLVRDGLWIVGHRAMESRDARGELLYRLGAPRGAEMAIGPALTVLVAQSSGVIAVG